MKVFISATLRSFFGRSTTEEAQGNTVNEALKELSDRFPEARQGLWDEKGELRSFIRIFAGKNDWTDKNMHDTPVPSGSSLLLLPLIAGGAPEEGIISEVRRKQVSLDNAEVDQFSRHLLLREIGVKGQKKIKAARVAVIGAGALGGPVLQYLAAAGVGTLKIVDFDTVAVPNLQSQVIHGFRDIRRPKAASARDKVRAINRRTEVIAENIKVDAGNVLSVIDGFDLVIDCTDNYQARYILNDACVICGIPLVYGAVYQYEGWVSIFNYQGGPCLRCLFPEPPEPGLVPTCAEGGTISPLSGIIGSIQATEALKLIIGIGEHLSGKLLRVDTMGLRSEVLEVRHRDDCEVCGSAPAIREPKNYDYEELCGLREDPAEEPVATIAPEDLARRIENGEPLTIVDVREPHERSILRFSGAIVIPIGQLARRQRELNPEHDTVFICKEGKRSILAVKTLREAGYAGSAYSLRGGLDAMKDIILSNEGGWI